MFSNTYFKHFNVINASSISIEDYSLIVNRHQGSSQSLFGRSSSIYFFPLSVPSFILQVFFMNFTNLTYNYGSKFIINQLPKKSNALNIFILDILRISGIPSLLLTWGNLYNSVMTKYVL